MFHWFLLRFWWNFVRKSRSAENEYENGNSEKENGYDTKRNILRIIIQNFDRTDLWKVRIVRSLADRTFQLRSHWSKWRSRHGKGAELDGDSEEEQEDAAPGVEGAVCLRCHSPLVHHPKMKSWWTFDKNVWWSVGELLMNFWWTFDEHLMNFWWSFD